MDKTKLGEILTIQDSIVNMQDLVIMERLSTKYPYCSIFKVLGAKYAKIVNSFNKQLWLQKASVYVSDREYLKEILSNIKIKPKSYTNKNQKPQEDIINKINAYQDQDISDMPTKQEIVDKFLKIEAPNSNAATESKNTSEESFDANIDRVIKQSAKKEFKIVTETMAKVYAKQGDNKKAIEIYQQLIVQNPKKSIYYTNQIEKLKNN